MIRSFARLNLMLFITASSISCQAQTLRNDRALLEEAGKEHAYPRLSADNKRVLYQSNKTGTWQLYILDIATGKQTQLTSGTHNNNFPDWSPDNKTIAFVSDRDGNEEIYTMQTDGKGLKRITNDPARDIHPYFSPDGKKLLFNSTRGNRSLDIFSYTFADGRVGQITSTPHDHETCARFSPGMDQIVFLRNNQNLDDIFVLDLKTGLSTNISKTPADMDGWPAYSTDGKWIYFSSTEQGPYALFRMRPDGSEKQLVTTPKDGLEDARVFPSRDNKQLVYNRKKGSTISIRMAAMP